MISKKLLTHFQFPIDHQRETLQNSGNTKAAHAAVDLSQFRNEEVGKGYQAKHVIRQAGAGATSKTSGIVDMSKNEKDESKPKPKEATTTETYLACRGMRNFIREIDKILENP